MSFSAPQATVRAAASHAVVCEGKREKWLSPRAPARRRCSQAGRQVKGLSTVRVCLLFICTIDWFEHWRWLILLSLSLTSELSGLQGVQVSHERQDSANLLGMRAEALLINRQRSVTALARLIEASFADVHHGDRQVHSRHLAGLGAEGLLRQLERLPECLERLVEAVEIQVDAADVHEVLEEDCVRVGSGHSSTDLDRLVEKVERMLVALLQQVNDGDAVEHVGHLAAVAALGPAVDSDGLVQRAKGVVEAVLLEQRPSDGKVRVGHLVRVGSDTEAVDLERLLVSLTSTIKSTSPEVASRNVLENVGNLFGIGPEVAAVGLESQFEQLERVTVVALLLLQDSRRHQELLALREHTRSVRPFDARGCRSLSIAVASVRFTELAKAVALELSN